MTALVNVNIVPMDMERVLAKHTVLVEGGWIVALGPSSKIKVPRQATQLDGRGQYLVPGFSDMHVHVTMGIDSAESERLLFRWLADGVTVVRNFDYGLRENGQALQLRDRAAAGTLWSPRIYTAGGWGPPHYYHDNRENRGRWRSLLKADAVPEPALDSIAIYIAAYKAAGYDFLKLRNERTPAISDSVLAAAQRLGITVVGHAPYGIQPERALASMKSLEHLTYQEGGWALGDGKAANIPTIAAAIQRAEIWICPTEMMEGSSRERRQFIKALQHRGVGLLLGTDVSASPHPRNSQLRVSYELQALVRAGLTPYQALVTGTRNPARYFGTLDESGTVAVGKRADLVLLRGNPLVDIGHTRQPAGVMIDGRWLARAELDRRLVGETRVDRKQYYRRYAERAYRADFILPFAESIHVDIAGRRTISDFQRQSFRESLKSVELAQGTLADSLAGLAPSKASRNDTTIYAAQHRILQLVGEQLGSFRTLLNATQQTQVFDPLARRWMQAYEREGYRVRIPGVGR